MRLNKMFQQNQSKKNFKCVEEYVLHQIIKFAIDETRSKKIKKNFRQN